MRTRFVLQYLLLTSCTSLVNPPTPAALVQDELPLPPSTSTRFEVDNIPRLPVDDRPPFDDLRGKQPTWRENGFDVYSIKMRPNDHHDSYIIVTSFGDRAYATTTPLPADKSRGIHCNPTMDCAPKKFVKVGDTTFMITKKQVYEFVGRDFVLRRSLRRGR